MSASVEFMIDTHFLSPVSMLSPKNITYTTSNVSLTVLCSEKINWAYYRLDDIDEAPTKDGVLSENFTLIGLSIGTHKVSVDVGTERGPFTETVYFSIAEPEPFPIALFVGSGVVAVAAVGLGLFVYFKKRRLSASDLS